MPAWTALEFAAAAAAGLYVATVIGCYLLARCASRTRLPPSAPPTPVLRGQESPALVNLLVNRGRPTQDAAESTLLDLAARRFLELRQHGADPVRTTVHPTRTDREALTGYEREVLGHVRAVSVGGVAPLAALSFPDRGTAQTWSRAVTGEVVLEARARGLSRRRLSPGVVRRLTWLVWSGGLAVTLLAGAALTVQGYRQTGEGGGVSQSVGVAFLMLLVCSAMTILVRRYLGEQLTPAGRAAAAHWLGVRAWLRAHPEAGRLPPAAVTVWDRYHSYGAALGTTPVASRLVHLGTGNQRRVWSAYGGRWRQVRVSYPRWLPWQRPRAWGMLWMAGGWQVAGLPLGYVDVVLTSTTWRFQALLAAAAAWWVVLLPAVAAQLATWIRDGIGSHHVTGHVLRHRPWLVEQALEDRPTWYHHVAIDDGIDDRTRAWITPAALAHQFGAGHTVRLRVRPWSRRVIAVEVLERTSPPFGTPGHAQSVGERVTSLWPHPG